MARELEIEDILIKQPNRRQRTSDRRKRQNSKGGGFIKFIAGVVLVLAVLVVTLSLADVGGSAILAMAQKYLNENYKISLNAAKITGNPIKGYTLHDFEISDATNNQKILSAGFLSGRVSFPALFTGKIRLAEISLGGVDTDVEQLMTTIENLKNVSKNFAFDSSTSAPVLVAPAYAEDENKIPDIPLDRFSLKDSRFRSQYGILEVAEVGADLVNFDVDLDGNINGLGFKGDVDMDTSLMSINRSEINFGSGKIVATGGLAGENLDFHASFENLDLTELTALYPDMLSSKDFTGKLNFNADAAGTLDAPRIFGTFDYNGAKIYGFPVERASANLSYAENRLAINNIQANALNVPIQGEIAVANRPGEKTSVMIKLDGTEANLDGLDKILKIPELKTLSGKVSAFSANISGPVDTLSGLVNFTAPKIAYQGRVVTNIKAQMKLAKSDTANVDGKFNFEGANGFLQGSIASILTKPNFNLTAKIANLDIKKIENMIPDASDYKLSGIITAAATLKGTTDNPVISGSLTSPVFSGFDQKITKPVINFTFADKILTLSKTEGTLNGMPINLSGTVGPLPSSNPNLNINATIAMMPANLKTYVPDINQYSLKGTVNAGLKIQGTVTNPSVRLVASSQNLQAMNMLTARDIELSTTAGGDLAKLEKISVTASAKSITASGITFNGVNATINKNDDKIILSGLNAKSGSGLITGAGTASISGKELLDFNFRFDNLELASLAAASGVELKGNLSGNLKIAGANANPEIFFNAGVPLLNAAGFVLNNLVADLSGTTKSLKFNKLKAEVEGSEIIALGNVQFSPMKYNVALNGSNVKLENLLREVSSMKGNLSGTAGFNFNVTGTDKGASGKGTLTAPALKAFGLKLTKVNLPLLYSGNSFASNNGTATLYGGSAKNNFNFDIKNMKFTDNIEVSGVDVNGLIQDAAGGLDGKITGTGKLTMKINGAVKDTTTYSGTGNFSMGEGSIVGFKWLDFVTRLHKSNGIRYTGVNAPLSLQTGKLIIKSGAIANAYKNDALYKYAKLTKDGVINFGGKDVTMDLTAEGNINYQLINALQGGSTGGLEALFKGGVSSFQDGLKTFLSAGLKQAEKVASTGDFRIVSLRISGKASSPSFSNLKIGASTLKAQTQTKSADTKQESFKEKIINNAINTIVPGANSTSTTDAKKKVEDTKTAVKDALKKEVQKRLPTSTPKTSTQNKNQNSQTSSKQTQTKQSTKDKIKSGLQDALKDEKTQERLKNELKKGLGGLFK
ncbi:MAG: hypothetical protein IJS40_02575 [Synergistaceae bacterium]|nr:hypothetical protein [Synergistaceae bacterium]